MLLGVVISGVILGVAIALLLDSWELGLAALAFAALMGFLAVGFTLTMELLIRILKEHRGKTEKSDGCP